MRMVAPRPKRSSGSTLDAAQAKVPCHGGHGWPVATTLRIRRAQVALRRGSADDLVAASFDSRLRPLQLGLPLFGCRRLHRPLMISLRSEYPLEFGIHVVGPLCGGIAHVICSMSIRRSSCSYHDRHGRSSVIVPVPGRDGAAAPGLHEHFSLCRRYAYNRNAVAHMPAGRRMRADCLINRVEFNGKTSASQADDAPVRPKADDQKV